jgi:hypothetical protein
LGLFILKLKSGTFAGIQKIFKLKIITIIILLLYNLPHALKTKLLKYLIIILLCLNLFILYKDTLLLSRALTGNKCILLWDKYLLLVLMIKLYESIIPLNNFHSFLPLILFLLKNGILLLIWHLKKMVLELLLPLKLDIFLSMTF